MNIRFVLIASSFAVLNAMAFIPKAIAQQTPPPLGEAVPLQIDNVTLTGEIDSKCQINSVTPGKLEQANKRTLLADARTGSPAIINVSCNDDVQFKITSINDDNSSLNAIAGQATTFASHVDGVFATVRDKTTNSVVANGDITYGGRAAITHQLNKAGATVLGPIRNKDFAVDMSIFKVGDSSELVPGRYSVKLGVNINPL